MRVSENVAQSTDSFSSAKKTHKKRKLSRCLIWISPRGKRFSYNRYQLMSLSEDKIMLEILFKDPVVWGSLFGLAVVIGLCAYYLYLFVYNTNHDL